MKLAAESTTERNTRLQQMRERHTAETTEGRHVRLVCDRAQHREQQNVQSQLPLFQQCSIQAKMSCEYNMATLYTSVALTAQRDFLASISTLSQLNVRVVVVTSILYSSA